MKKFKNQRKKLKIKRKEKKEEVLQKHLLLLNLLRFFSQTNLNSPYNQFFQIKILNRGRSCRLSL